MPCLLACSRPCSPSILRSSLARPFPERLTYFARCQIRGSRRQYPGDRIMEKITMSSRRPGLPMTGGCQCGAIRFELKGLPLLLYTCNCTDCQRQSGSSFALNMPVATKDLRIVQGQPKGWRHLSAKGVKVTSRFCADCGTRLFGEREGRDEILSVRAGTLDDTSWMVPAAHFYTRSAQPWFKPADGAECFEEQPHDFAELVEAWRSRWSS